VEYAVTPKPKAAATGAVRSTAAHPTDIAPVAVSIDVVTEAVEERFATPPAALGGGVAVRRRVGFGVAGDGSYAACLAEAAGDDEGEGKGGWFVERWSLDGPEPYTVALPGPQPERPGTQVLPLPDGRVLVAREPEEPGAPETPEGPAAAPAARPERRTDLALLYPSGAGTGQQPLGSLAGREVRLLPPPAAGAYATCWDGEETTVWRVCGTPAGVPVQVARVAGRCGGGVWLDRAGRLLALDRELGGRTKAVAVDLHTGTVSPLLQLTEESEDRLLLADPDSGLMIVRSDAAGEARLGWGVLGSRHPVRFPEALRMPGARLTPLAVQPGNFLSPESAVLALHCEVPGGARWLALWRPGDRELHWRATPPGWLGPTAVWLPSAPLRLPAAPPALHPYDPPPPPVPPRGRARRTRPVLPAAAPRPALPAAAAAPATRPARRTLSVLPLQQAPLSPVA
jgi:hypothetical protein